MQLEFTEEQEELRGAVRAVLARECPMTVVREVVEKGTTPAPLWSHMVELGWPALTVSEQHGGLGLGMVELAVVVEELGRAVAPGPFLPTVTQFAPAVREAGSVDQRDRFLAAVAGGGLTGTLAIAEDGGGCDPTATTCTAEPVGGDRAYRLTGEKHAVVEAASVDELVVVARLPGSGGDEGVGAFVVPTADAGVYPVRSLDPSRGIARVALEGVVVDAERVLGEPGAATARALRRVVDEATTALALEMVGTCQTIFDVTLEYAKQREQFGTAIGSFQAIKHKFADMLVALERARATAYFAALTIAEGDDRRTMAASSAKAAAGDCARLVATEGIQIHGGIGYTWDHDMHLYVRRVRADGLLFGTTAEHTRRIAELIGL